MSTKSDRYIPLFPLPVLLFPEEEMPLHIFEPRYKQLIKDCIHNRSSFGIPYVRGSFLEKFGSEVNLRRVIKTYHDDSMDISVEAFNLVKITHFDEVMAEKQYGAGNVEDFPQPDLPVPGSTRDRYLEFQRRFNGEEVSAVDLENLTALQLAAGAGFSYDQKLEILNLQHSEDQHLYVHRELQLLYKIREMEEGSIGKFHLN